MNRLRALSVRDAKEAAAIHAACFPEPWPTELLSTWLSAPQTLALGAPGAGPMAAFVLIQRAAEDAEILTLATSPQNRRAGHARDLICGAAAMLAHGGEGRLLLDVAADNVAAHALYRELGFKIDGVRPNYYRRMDGNRVDAVLMSRAITGLQHASAAKGRYGSA